MKRSSVYTKLIRFLEAIRPPSFLSLAFIKPKGRSIASWVVAVPMGLALTALITVVAYKAATDSSFELNWRGLNYHSALELRVSENKSKIALVEKQIELDAENNLARRRRCQEVAALHIAIAKRMETIVGIAARNKPINTQPSNRDDQATEIASDALMISLRLAFDTLRVQMQQIDAMQQACVAITRT